MNSNRRYKICENQCIGMYNFNNMYRCLLSSSDIGQRNKTIKEVNSILEGRNRNLETPRINNASPWADESNLHFMPSI